MDVKASSVVENKEQVSNLLALFCPVGVIKRCVLTYMYLTFAFTFNH